MVIWSAQPDLPANQMSGTQNRLFCRGGVRHQAAPRIAMVGAEVRAKEVGSGKEEEFQTDGHGLAPTSTD